MNILSLVREEEEKEKEPIVALKPLTEKYITEINTFWQRDWSQLYSLPDQESSIIDAVAVRHSDNKAIAYGQVRLFPEMMLFTDMLQPRRDRATAVKLLMEEGFRGIDGAGLKEAYCLIRDMKFARLIAQRYGFKLITDPGVLLYRRMI